MRRGPKLRDEEISQRRLRNVPTQQEIRSRLVLWMRQVEGERAIDEYLFREGVNAERIAVPDHHIRALAGFEGADAIIEAQRLGGIDGEPADRAFRCDRQTNALAM